MPSAQPATPIYQLKVTLLDIAPPIWRRVHVPSTIRLCCLHDVFQTVVGWTDSHLHQWEKDGEYWGVPEDDEFGDLELKDESRVPLDKLVNAAGDSLIYVYDFGDNWRHKVVLEKVLPADSKSKTPICLAGKRRCPPEDVGGPHGYQEFLDAIFDPAHEEFEHYRQWAGNPVHAEEFDLEAVNDVLSKLKLPIRHNRGEGT